MASRDNATHISITTGTIFRAIFIIILFFLAWYLRELILVVLTAIVIASFMESSAPYFKKIGINRVVGIVFLYVVTILIFAGLFYLFAPLLITEIFNFSTAMSSYFPDLPYLSYFQNGALGGAKDVVSSLSGRISFGSLLSVSRAFVVNLSGGVFQILSVMFGSIFNVVLIVLISFYLSIQEGGIENFLRIVTPNEYDEYVVDLWRRSSKKIGLWVKGQMLLGVVVGILIYLILSLLGIEYALLLALVTGIMEMVPYGILVALVPTFSFSYISDGWGRAFMVTGAYVIIHQFEVFLFAPLVIKKIVGLSPIVIILSVLIGFELGGVWGAVLSIPLSIVFMELLNDFEKDKNLARANK